MSPIIMVAFEFSRAMVNRNPMNRLLKIVGLLLLLMAAQQGAVVHELSHFAEAKTADLRVSSNEAATPCALCLAFAQVVAPAFSHSFHIPLLVRFALERVFEPLHAAIDAAVPPARSRGPPVRS
jgi:hypothetical protein